MNVADATVFDVRLNVLGFAIPLSHHLVNSYPSLGVAVRLMLVPESYDPFALLAVMVPPVVFCV